MKPWNVLPILYNNEHCYNIELHHSFDGLCRALNEVQLSNKRICIVTDSNVNELYGDEVEALLQDQCNSCRLRWSYHHQGRFRQERNNLEYKGSLAGRDSRSWCKMRRASFLRAVQGMESCREEAFCKEGWR